MEEFSYFATSIGENQRYFASKSYHAGDIVKIRDQNDDKFRYFELSESIFRDQEIRIEFDTNNVGNWQLSKSDGSIFAQEFYGNVKEFTFSENNEAGNPDPRRIAIGNYQAGDVIKFKLDSSISLAITFKYISKVV